jgi:hypothetical protein
MNLVAVLALAYTGKKGSDRSHFPRHTNDLVEDLGLHLGLALGPARLIDSVLGKRQ